MIYIISSKKAAALGLPDKCPWAKIVKNTKEQEIQADEQVYLDISGLSSTELKKAITSLKKSRTGSFWGVIDPKGTAADPALFFFEGAGDYIGPALVKKGLDKKRFAAAEALVPRSTGSLSAEKQKSPAMLSSKVKLPAGKFEGWKSLRAGTTAPFLFLFVSVSGLRSKVGDAGFTAVKNRLRDFLQQTFAAADALLWMETENNSLFLVPPRTPNARVAVEAGLKLILNSRFVAFEKLGLLFPVDFTIALHYGKTVFRAPGKTGSVIAESVNYIFHLGGKKADPGRLTISGEVPEDALPEGLLDIFSSAGVFEGIPVIHSRRFVYK